jgi:hypothetical protein
MHRLKNDQQDENSLRRIPIGAHFQDLKASKKKRDDADEL